MQKTLLQTIHGPFVFPKTAALTPTKIVSVFVGFISGWIYFQQAFFFLSRCLARLRWIFLTLPCADSQAETPVIRAIKILKASRIPYLTLWWDFMALMRHRSYSGQEVFPWQLSTPLMIHVSKMFFFFFLRARTKFVISPLLISTA